MTASKNIRGPKKYFSSVNFSEIFVAPQSSSKVPKYRFFSQSDLSAKIGTQKSSLTPPQDVNSISLFISGTNKMDEGGIGNCLDGGVRVPKTCWKHHKSKDWNFLHRNYTPNFFSTPSKNIFSRSIKNSFFDFSGNGDFSKGSLINPL